MERSGSTLVIFRLHRPKIRVRCFQGEVGAPGRPRGGTAHAAHELARGHLAGLSLLHGDLGLTVATASPLRCPPSSSAALGTIGGGFLLFSLLPFELLEEGDVPVLERNQGLRSLGLCEVHAGLS